MSWERIKALVCKDLKLYYRDKFFGVMTVFCIVVFLVIYFVMPSTVDETIVIGLYAPQASSMFLENIEEEGLIIRNVKSEEKLKQAVTDKEVHVGISIPRDMQKSFTAGGKPQVFVYFSSDFSDEIKDIYTILISETINQMSGYGIDIDVQEIVLGPDMGGKQIPYRDRMLPLFVFMMLFMGTFGVATLITSELEIGTVQALLVTPMKVIDLFAGKSITGIVLAFSQAAVFLIITGSLTHNILFIIVALLLGSVMVTGMAFFIASISKDLMSVVAWGSLLMIVLFIPGVAVIFPGPVSGWIKIVPSFFLIDILHRAVNFDIGWSGNFRSMMFLIGFNIVFVFLGIITLKRRVNEY